MSKNLEQQQQAVATRFVNQFPPFTGVGASFPIFQDNPNYNHIRQFIERETAATWEAAQKECNYCLPCHLSEAVTRTGCEVCANCKDGEVCEEYKKKYSHGMENQSDMKTPFQGEIERKAFLRGHLEGYKKGQKELETDFDEALNMLFNDGYSAALEAVEKGVPEDKKPNNNAVDTQIRHTENWKALGWSACRAAVLEVIKSLRNPGLVPSLLAGEKSEEHTEKGQTE